jgi:hypothetical protein
MSKRATFIRLAILRCQLGRTSIGLVKHVDTSTPSKQHLIHNEGQDTDTPLSIRSTSEQALINELNKIYANRILYGIGLCICVFDMAVGEDKVRYGVFSGIQVIVLYPLVSDVVDAIS